MLNVRHIAAVVLLMGLFLAPRGLAGDVPIGVQLPLLAKVWKLDRNFGSREVVRIAVVFQHSNPESAAMKDAVVAWVASRPGLRAIPVAVDTDAGMATLQKVEADVFYVTRMRGANVWDVAKVARTRDIRTMTGVPEYVRRGLAIAIDVRNDRPMILVNLDAARAEGAAYQAQLLRLTSIVRDLPTLR